MKRIYVCGFEGELGGSFERWEVLKEGTLEDEIFWEMIFGEERVILGEVIFFGCVIYRKRFIAEGFVGGMICRENDGKARWDMGGSFGRREKREVRWEEMWGR